MCEPEKSDPDKKRRKKKKIYLPNLPIYRNPLLSFHFIESRICFLHVYRKLQLSIAWVRVFVLFLLPLFSLLILVYTGK